MSFSCFVSIHGFIRLGGTRLLCLSPHSLNQKSIDHHGFN